MSQYRTGTVDVTNASAVVTGTDTVWTGLSTPLYFKVDEDGAPVYEVASIDSDTQITLTASYAGSTETDKDYQLTQDFSANYNWPLPSQGDFDAGDWLRRTVVEIDSDLANLLQGLDSFANFNDGDSTPSVSAGRNFKTVNSSSTTITAFDNGVNGKEIWVIIGDNNTTFDFSSSVSALRGNGGQDWKASSGDHLIAKYDGTNWYCSISQNS